MEALRWRPPATIGKCVLKWGGQEIDRIFLIGVAHRATEDIIWVRHLSPFVRKTCAEQNNIPEGSINSCGRSCHWMSLVIMVVICS